MAGRRTAKIEAQSKDEGLVGPLHIGLRKELRPVPWRIPWPMPAKASDRPEVRNGGSQFKVSSVQALIHKRQWQGGC